MTDASIPDHRESNWWGVLLPRPTRNSSLFSKLMSVLVVPIVLLIGTLIAMLQFVTLPILIVVLLVIKWSRGTLPASHGRGVVN